MEMVKVKTKSDLYDGFIRGYKFNHGVAEVPASEVEALKEFEVELVEPEQPKEAPKKSTRKKQGE